MIQVYRLKYTRAKPETKGVHLDHPMDLTHIPPLTRIACIGASTELLASIGKSSESLGLEKDVLCSGLTELAEYS